MAMKRDGESQPDLIVSWADVPRSPGHAFYDKLQKVLVDAGFDRFVEESCQAYYAARMGAPSVPPGRYFRMLLIGYFEGIHSERGIVWLLGFAVAAGVLAADEPRDVWRSRISEPKPANGVLRWHGD